MVNGEIFKYMNEKFFTEVFANINKDAKDFSEIASLNKSATNNLEKYYC